MKPRKHIIFILFFLPITGFTDEYKGFKTEFLTYLGHNEKIDLDEKIKPGKHYVLVYVNGEKISTENIDFKQHENDLLPCFSQHNLSKFNLNYNKLNLINKTSSACFFIENILEGAYAIVDFDDERLDVNIPQIYLSSEVDDYIYPSQWNRGVNSHALKYDMNITNIRDKRYSDIYSYHGHFEQHLNLYSWRIYTNNVLSARNNSSINNKFYDLYAERSIASLKSSLTIGEINTNGDYFNWVKYKGVKLASDNRMNATSLSGFAPSIRGIANSPSLLSIEYNGRVIYEKNIPAGEYHIQDLPRTYGNGVLNVILTGADGVRTVQEIPVSTISSLIRPGSYEYSVNIGSLDSMYPGDYWLTQANVKYGINNNLTMYSGLQSIHPYDYAQTMIGGTFNTRIGGISLDYYRSFSDEKRPERSSCSLFCNDKLVLNYEENLSLIDTSLSMSVTRYLDKNYWELNDFIANKYNYEANRGLDSFQNKQTSNLVLRKSLPDNYGSISGSGYYAKPWKGNGTDTYGYSLSYDNNFKKINYNISLFSFKNKNNSLDNTFFISSSIPFETKNKNLNFNSSYVNYSDSYNTRMSLAANDKSFDKVNYNFWMDRGTQNSFGNGGSLSYNNGANTKQAGYSKNENSEMIYGNINGAMILHEGGITKSSELGKTFAIVKAIGAEGMSISLNSNIKINANGYGVAPYLSPYKKNYITLDSKKSNNMSEIEENRLLVIPDNGSSPLVEFKIKKIGKNILKIHSVNYEIPFGAEVVDVKNNVVGITDQSGFVLLPEEYEELAAIWSKDSKDYKCKIIFRKDSDISNSIINADCI
ncbi:fimbria/pilus outer membrane usher protein [uncultured Cedecea sp.]|uniref:fimbria/pilus outer membrane usher protein n=1 Tax=uncultured Cedecea sp. TaxID=988762 RepID=UPI00260E89E1|nr:fimbria/pilus outer membrane usher protein [uncultured Cedecea sp.]